MKDLLLEFPFTADSFQTLLTNAFKSDNMIDKILHLLSNSLGPISKLDPFKLELSKLELSLKRPKDIQLNPPNAENPLDIHLRIGPDGKLATLRMVVGVVVNHTDDPKYDCLQIDFQNHLYYIGVISPLNLVGPEIINGIKKILPCISVLSLEVNRAPTVPDAKKLQRFDFVILEDRNTANHDAVAEIISFGGNQLQPGDNMNIPYLLSGGGRGVAQVGLTWLCRIITPILTKQFGLPPDSFIFQPSGCSLKSPLPIHIENQDVTLTKLGASMQSDGSILISSKISKIFNHITVSEEISNNVTISITNGKLQASQHMNDVVRSIDIPWYMYLALLSPMTAIIFGVEILISNFLLEGISKVGDEIASAINDSIPDVDVPALGMSAVLSEVHVV